MLLSLSFFSSQDKKECAPYDLMLETAKWADSRGFHAIWTPERHFDPFGGLFANPSITSAALACVTKNLQIRAGSVVLPLHNPLRVAEEWAMVDGLSRQRVGLALASGWHARDFVFLPHQFSRRHEILATSLETLRLLWKGQKIILPDGEGVDKEVEIFPKPLHGELPLWFTSAGHLGTFEQAGRQNVSVLTHLLGQSVEELEVKIRHYRSHLPQGKHKGHVTLMLHTFVGKDPEEVRFIVKPHLRSYLRSALLLENRRLNSLTQELDAEDVEDVLDFAFDRYFESSGLFGTPQECKKKIHALAQLGVDEIACLIDFGPTFEQTMESLELLQTCL